MTEPEATEPTGTSKSGAAGRPTPPAAPTLDPAWGPGTLAVHAGRFVDRNAGAVVPPIYQTSTFHFPAPFSEASETRDVQVYTRNDNPTLRAAAESLRALEGAGAARVFASGMAAISATVIGLLRAGDEIAASEAIYGGSRRLFEKVLPGLGLPVRWIPSEAEDPTPYLGGSVRLLFLETPSNPFLHVRDLARWAAAADAAGALLVVDNTFATPVNQRPLGLGADLVVHSASKYLAGHSDVIAGAIAGPPELVERVAETQRLLGGTLDPFAGFLLHRGLRTLGLRVARHNENGARVAEAARNWPEVAGVHYPGSASEAEEATARRQMRGRGGMVTLELAGGEAAAARFLGRLRLVHVASSLGGVESLASRPWDTSHIGVSDAERARLGITAATVRLSCGIEETEDLLDDLRQALRG